MKSSEYDNSIGFRLSYSSTNTFKGCKRKFWYEKIKGLDPDSDYEENASALQIGKLFHKILELCSHDKDLFNLKIVEKAIDAEGIDSAFQILMVQGMVRKYLDLHFKSGLNIEYCELEVGDTKVRGFIDAIMSDNQGNWWIVDLKTSARITQTLLARLRNDPQLNLYSYFKGQIAEKLGLDVDKFQGARYRVTTKPFRETKKWQDNTSFLNLCYETCESYDIELPAECLNPQASYKAICNIFNRVEVLKEANEIDVEQNFGYCESYFKPCQYWSKCYGELYSKSHAGLNIATSKNMKTLNKPELKLDLNKFLEGI